MKNITKCFVLVAILLTKPVFSQVLYDDHFYRQAQLPIRVNYDSLDFDGFKFIDEQIGFLFTHYNDTRLDSNLIVWHTSNGGLTWSPKKFNQIYFKENTRQNILQKSPTGRIYFTSVYYNPNHNCAIGTGGSRYMLNYSDDNGLNWNQEEIGDFQEYTSSQSHIYYRELSQTNFIIQKMHRVNFCGYNEGIHVGNNLLNPISINGDTPVDIAIDQDSSSYWYWSYDELVQIDSNFVRKTYPAYLPISDYNRYAIRVNAEWVYIFHEVEDPEALGAGASYRTGVYSYNRVTGNRGYKLYINNFSRNINQVGDHFFTNGIEYIDISEDSAVYLNLIEKSDYFDDNYVQYYFDYQWLNQDTGFIVGYSENENTGNPNDSRYILFKTTTGQPYNIKWESYEANASVNKVLDLSNYVEIYPNPSSDYLSIKSVQEIQNLQVINELGQVVLNEEELSADSKLDIRTLPPGIYTLKIKLGNDQFSTKRFLKNKIF